jgi:hypothetical protein
MPTEAIIAISIFVIWLIGIPIALGVIDDDTDAGWAFVWPLVVFVFFPVALLYGLGKCIRRLITGSWD